MSEAQSGTAEPDRPRIALVGAGVIGHHHGLVISELADRVELVAVVDVHRERAEQLAAERGGKAYAFLTEALEAVDVDIVVVCTPTGQHGELAIGDPFVHESIIGTRFTGRLVEETTVGGRPAALAEITGRAWITGIGHYLLDPTDPFPAGFRLA